MNVLSGWLCFMSLLGDGLTKFCYLTTCFQGCHDELHARQQKGQELRDFYCVDLEVMFHWPNSHMTTP